MATFRRARALAALVATCAIALSQTSCKKAEAVTEHLLYLDSVDGPATVSVGQPAIYTISGHKPDPAWQVDPPVVERQGAVVTISVVGHRAHKAMAIQMLVPFSTTATVSDLPAGRFTVEVKGFRQTLGRTLIVTP